MAENASRSLRELGITNLNPDGSDGILQVALTEFGSLQAISWFAKLALRDTEMLGEGQVYLYPGTHSDLSDIANYYFFLTARDLENAGAQFPGWLPWWVQV